MTRYPDVMSQKRTFLREVNIYLIWIMYFLQVLFQLVFGVNFIVAILER